MSFYNGAQGNADSFDFRMLLDQDSSASTSTCSARCHQERTLMVLPILLGIVSIICSSLVLYMIATHPTSAHVLRRQGRIQRGGASKLTYERIMIGLTCAEFINSFQCMVAPFTVPAGTPGFWYASGTQATCTAQGFFKMLGHSTAYYSTALAIYFVLSMIPSVNDDTIKQQVEPFLHSVSITVPVVIAILGLVLQLYNPAPGGDNCTFATYPSGCDQLGDSSSCTRGQATDLVTGYVMGFVLILFCIIIVCMVSIYMLAWLQHRKMKSLYLNTTNDNTTSNRTTNTTAAGSSLRTTFFARPSMTKPEDENHQLSIFQQSESSKQQQEQDRERQNGSNRKLRRIATQGLLYIFAFLITRIWTVLLISFFDNNKQDWYIMLHSTSKLPTYILTLRLTQKTLFPLQGMLNFFIYIRPRYIDLRAKSSSTVSRYEALRIIVFNCPTTPQGDSAIVNQKQQSRVSKCLQTLCRVSLCCKSKQSPESATADIKHTRECNGSILTESNKLKNIMEDGEEHATCTTKNDPSNDVVSANVDIAIQEQDETGYNSESCEDSVQNPL